MRFLVLNISHFLSASHKIALQNASLHRPPVMISTLNLEINVASQGSDPGEIQCL